jgi:hypothetical protein
MKKVFVNVWESSVYHPLHCIQGESFVGKKEKKVGIFRSIRVVICRMFLLRFQAMDRKEWVCFAFGSVFFNF